MTSEDAELRWLREDLCGKLGICLAERQINGLVRDQPRERDSLSDAILVAEGLDPLTVDERLRTQVRERVAVFLERTSSLT